MTKFITNPDLERDEPPRAPGKSEKQLIVESYGPHLTVKNLWDKNDERRARMLLPVGSPESDLYITADYVPE